MLVQLRNEREQIEAAILALERIAQGGGKRRGRPPKWLAEQNPAGTEAEMGENSDSGKRRHFSPEARKRMAEAQRKRWAARRGEQT